MLSILFDVMQFVLFIKMKVLLVLCVAVMLAQQTCGATVKKCINCNQCEIHRNLKEICTKQADTRCLKFVGYDKNSEFIWPTVIGDNFCNLFLFPTVSMNKTVTHKHCSPPSGCSEYAHNKNYTIATCLVCMGSLCNTAEVTDHSIFFAVVHFFIANMAVNYMILE